jgi:predicted GNAT superfamily acetyltransferase
VQARTIDIHICGIVNEHLDALSSRLTTTAYPDTYRAMLSLFVRTNSLKAAMLDSLESDNTYASRTLLRCLCEHYLKFLYIWVRFTHERSDAAAREYYRFCDAHELQEGLDVLTAAGTLVSKTVSQDLRKVIETQYPDVAMLGSDALAHRVDQFHCRSIVEFLARNDSGVSPDELPLLDRVIPTWALLARGGRGGPCMDVDSPDASALGTLQASVEDASLVVALPAIVFMFTALAISREYPEHADIAPTICALIERSALESEGPSLQLWRGPVSPSVDR